MSSGGPGEALDYVGRFAPSPTGDLHFGSLVAAVASYFDARRHQGAWKIRIDDIDPPRTVAGSAESILADLQRLGFEPDGDILRQSTRTSAYRDAVRQLKDTGRAFDCGCSRSDLDGHDRYPGTCRDGLPPGKSARSVRFVVPQESIVFSDRIQGAQSFDLENVGGDFVIWRADDLPAYQLAAAVDDAWQGITDVVRGADLLDSTPRQLAIQQALSLPSPRYAHVPVVTGIDGRKLSKRTRDDPIRNAAPHESIRQALRFLGHDPGDRASLEDLHRWAQAYFDLSQVPREAAPS